MTSTITRRGLLQSAASITAAAPLIMPTQNSQAAKGAASHRGVQAINTDTGLILAANNFANLPVNMSRFIGSYWYWHTTPITGASTSAALLRAGRLLKGGDSGQMLLMDHNWQGSYAALQFGISSPLTPLQTTNWWSSGAIPTGNLGWNNLIYGIDSTLQNPPRFILNGAPIAAIYNPNSLNSSITAALSGNPVWHLAAGLGGRNNNVPQNPFKGYMAEFIMYDMTNVAWVDPLNIVGNFYDATNEIPPSFKYLDPTGLAQSPVPGLAPLFYFRGWWDEYVIRNHMHDTTAPSYGRLIRDPNEILNLAGGSFGANPPSDPWGFVGS